MIGQNGLELTLHSMQAMDVLRQVDQWGSSPTVHMEEPGFEEAIHRVY